MIGGIALQLIILLIDEPDAGAMVFLKESISIIPNVLASGGVVLLFLVTRRQHEEQVKIVRDLELARIQGQRWRSEARTLLNGLGEAIDKQFSR